jgi:Kef-type K+ transport system membrane component KefB/voltage-gated potassium channel Kch
VVLGLAGKLLGLPWAQSFVAGFILSLSSTAIVLQSLREKGLHQTSAGRGSFATLLFQDIAVIPMLAVFPLLAPVAATAEQAAHGGNHGWVSALTIPGSVLAVVLAGRWGLPPLFGFIAKSGLREIFTATALLLVLAVGGLMTLVGLSPALGAFLGGVILAGSPYRHELESDLEPFKGLLLGLFFMSVGASMDMSLLYAEPLRIGLMLLGFVSIKGGLLWILAAGMKLGVNQRTLFAVALFQGGEFAFVLLTQTLGMGLLPAGLAAELNAVVALSMALTPVALLVYQRFFSAGGDAAAAAANGREPDPVEAHAAVILAGFGRFGNFVGRMIRAQGLKVVVLESDAEHVDLVRGLGMEVHYGDATRLDILHSAGAAQARLMIITLDDEHAIDELVAACQQHFPQMELIVRAKSIDHRMRLLNSGIQHVFHEMAGSAIDAAAQALRSMGMPAYAAERAHKGFRRHDMQMARELAPHRDETETYFRLVKERVAGMQELFAKDRVDLSSGDSKAWSPPYSTQPRR